MKVLGIDQSLTASGYAVLDEHENVLRLGCITPKIRGVERLCTIEQQVLDIINEEDIKAVGIEGYAYGTYMKSEVLGELGGVLKRAFYLVRLPTYVIPPTKVKKFATGKGNANKTMVVTSTVMKYNLDIKNDNEADAFVIARMVLAKVLGLTDLKAYELESLKDVKVMDWDK